MCRAPDEKSLGQGAPPHLLVHAAALPPCLASLSSALHRTHLSITFTWHLHLPNALGPPRVLLQIMDTLATVYFRGPKYVLHPGTGGVALLVLEVLACTRMERHGGNGAEGAQSKEPLFEVRCTLNVHPAMPIGRCVVHPLHIVCVHT